MTAIKITTLAKAREHETRLMAELAHTANDVAKASDPAALANAIGRYQAAESGLKTLQRGMKRHFKADLANEPQMTDDELMAALTA